MAIEVITFEDPAQGKGSARVVIDASSLDRQSACRLPLPLRSGFTGLTLNGVEHTGAVALFYTQSEFFQIDVIIPGVLAPSQFGPATATPTPIPADWLATDQTEVNALLRSFRPSDPKPLTC